MKKLGGDMVEFGKKTHHRLIFLPHYMWAENNIDFPPPLYVVGK